MIELHLPKERRFLATTALAIVVALGLIPFFGALTPPAYAHRDNGSGAPVTSCVTGIGISVGAFWHPVYDTNDLVVVLSPADEGKTIYLIANTSKQASNNCAYEGNHTATAVNPTSWVIVDPHGVSHDVVPTGGLACIGGSFASSVLAYPCTNRLPWETSKAAAYVVNFTDIDSFKEFSYRTAIASAHIHNSDTDGQVNGANTPNFVPTEMTTLTKTPSAQKVENNTSVTYTFNETNIGSSDFTQVSISDSNPDCSQTMKFVSGDVGGDNVLSPGESWIFTCSATLTKTTTNFATAHGTDINGTDIGAIDPNESARSTVTVIHPNIGLTKTPNVTDCVTIGTNVTYSYNVTNTGDTTLFNVNVTDDKYGAIGGPITLNVGEFRVFTHSAIISQNITNTATAVGVDQNGTKVTAEAKAFVCVKVPPSFDFHTLSSKTGTTSGPGGTVVVTDPTETKVITLKSGDNLTGTFHVTANLTSSTGLVFNAICAPSSTPPPPASDGSGKLPISFTCILTDSVANGGNGTNFAISDASTQYCWNNSVTETSGTYKPSTVSKAGKNDASNECFTLTPTSQPRMNGGGRVNPDVNTLAKGGVVNGGVYTNFKYYDSKAVTTGNNKPVYKYYILTHGFELHCAPTVRPNNLQINFPSPANNGATLTFHMDRLDLADCVDNFNPQTTPNSGAPQPPPSGTCLIVNGTGGKGPGPCEDTYYGAGKGRLFNAKNINKLNGNEGCGAVAYWTFTDGDVYNSKSIKNAGEPGKRDRIVSLAIYDNAGVLQVRWDGQIWGTAQSTSIATNALKFPGYFLNTGNHQFLPASFPNAPVRACQNQDLGAAVATLQPTDFQAQRHVVGQADKPFP